MKILEWVWARLPVAVALAWEWVAWAASAVRSSFVALIKSPAAWLACAVVFGAGFSLGHIERARVVHELVKQRAELVAGVDALTIRVRSLTADAAKARQEAQDAKAALAAVKQAATPERPPAVTPAPARRRAKPKTAAPAPQPAPFSSWNPFKG